MLSNKLTSFFAGVVCGLSFAPVFFLPGIFCISILVAQIKISISRYQSLKFGYMFGFGFYLATLYWISFGVSVYIDEFWWAIPFALFGLPAFIAIFTSVIAGAAWQFRATHYFHFCFCVCWVFIEWVISWIFTGLPWGAIGYAFSNLLILTQFASIVGIFGLSFVAVYVGSGLYNFFGKDYKSIELKNFYLRIIMSILLLGGMSVYGIVRLNSNQTEYTNISTRLVQPSISQSSKWDPETFWHDLNLHISLSRQNRVFNSSNFIPDLIIWSEAALTVPYDNELVMKKILTAFTHQKQILLSGGVTDNNQKGDDLELYTSLIGIKSDGSKILEYHKSHLVPFGEYMPLKKILPFKKITHGLLDYTEGKRTFVVIEDYNLTLWPLICYESIFPYEIRVSNQSTDVMVNVTNDAWYGNSSGPYQHFEISRMRAIENGLPMLRVANNGISGIVDSVGRVLNKTKLNEIVVIDNYIPKKLASETLFSRYGLLMLLIIMCLIIALQSSIRAFLN